MQPMMIDEISSESEREDPAMDQLGTSQLKETKITQVAVEGMLEPPPESLDQS